MHVAAAMRLRQRVIVASILHADNIKRTRAPKRDRIPVLWRDHIARLRPHEFAKRYRLSLEAFGELVTRLRVHMPAKNERMHYLSKPNSPPIELEVQVACTLRWLAGGATSDLQLVYNIESATMYVFIWVVIDAINAALKIESPFGDTSKLSQLAADFRGYKRDGSPRAPGVFFGQVGAIDGIHFAMTNPGKAVENPLSYYVARKGCFALLCIAICDAQMRFTFADFRQSPTTHDSLAFRATELGAAIAQGCLPWPYFLNGDSAFIAGPNMVTPSSDDADFDFVQSSRRVIIERSFGVLVRRWPILWRPLDCMFDRRIALVTACMKLHNFCIDTRISELPYRTAAGRSEVQPDRWAVPPRANENSAPEEYIYTTGHFDQSGRDQAAPNYSRMAQLKAAMPRGWQRPYPRGKAPARVRPRKPAPLRIRL